MKRVVPLVGLSVAMVLSASMIAEAQSKKKGKEPELAISKRGKLIFEDDFSGKDFLWSFDETKCQWKTIKGSLATKSSGVGAQLQVRTAFPSVKEFILEFKIWLPMQTDSYFYVGGIGGPTLPYGRLRHLGNAICVSIVTYYPGDTREHTPTSIPYRKPTWLEVVFEKLENKYALTVAGKTMTYELPEADPTGKSSVLFCKSANNDELFAIDNVKIYEALPKDEGEDKDEKGKKNK
ncbi:MAG: hypothetical protein AB1696_09355 [Planctomycetota bacterium]